MPRTITPVELPQTDEELRVAFGALRTRADIAALLGISEHELIYLLYRDGKNYIEFNIPKRSGGTRHISAPTGSIKFLQKRLNQVLRTVYRPKAPVHGFALGRSILTNADRHVRKRLIFNVDLQDFFPTIHFGRVRGVFASEPYSLPLEAAQVLAQICTHHGTLPQGAPTSPIVSNMVCVSLDSGLRRLAADHACTYTRYADDLTFSTTRKAFPSVIVTASPGAGDRVVHGVGDALRQVIEGNGFYINNKKVRLRTPGQRREVTGLIVTKGINVPREFIKNVRGMLHAWEKYGPEAAEAELRERHHRKHRRPGSPPVSLVAVVAGKLEFIRMVRTSSDLLYTRLWNRFAVLAGADYRPKVAIVNRQENISSALWLLESFDLDDPTTIKEGTAFMLAGYGLVSCDHCIGREPIVASQPGLLTQGYTVTVTHRCQDRDLVRLKIVGIDPLTALAKGESASVQQSDQVVVAGFGNYAAGGTARLLQGRISGMGHRDPVPEQVFFSDHRAFPGHSGGPALTSDLKVIGVLQRAISPNAPEQETTILPISMLDHVPPVPPAPVPQPGPAPQPSVPTSPGPQ